jgi:hypothetical protein
VTDKISLISERTTEEGIKLKVQITFKTGEKKEFVCDYFGHSTEYPPMMILLDDGEHGESFPVAVVNSDEIILMETIEVIKTTKPMGSAEGVH